MSSNTEDNVVIIEASSGIRSVEAGASSGSSSGCDWTLYVADDLASPIFQNGVELFDPSSPIHAPNPTFATERLFSETGRWWSATGAECVDNGLAGIYAEGDAISLPELVDQAEALLDPPEADGFETNPLDNGGDRFLVVQVPTWFWIEEGYWTTTWTHRLNFPAAAPRLWVEAYADAVTTEWSPGDGTGWIECLGDRREWARGTPETDANCSHTYTLANSSDNASYGVQGRVWFDTRWTSDVPGQPGGPLDPIFRDTTVRELRVGEIQAVETAAVRDS